MNTPLISIIVPVYNMEKYLKRCVDSLLQQTYKNIEIILVDDGSPDNCGIICDDYANKHDNIKILHQKNQGLSAARNNGVEISSGEYIAFADPDDLIPAYSIECLYDALVKEKADISVGNRMEFFEGQPNPVLKKSLNSSKNIICYDTEQAMKAICYAKPFGVASWGKLYKRQLIVECPYPIGMIHEDLATTYKIIARCKKVVGVQEVIYCYFQRKDSIMHCEVKPKHIEDGMKAAKEQLQFIQKFFPSVEAGAKFRYCLKIIEYIPRLIDGSKQSYDYFSYLQKEIKPYIVGVCCDSNVSIFFKIKCMALIMGYVPSKLLWKTIYKIKGRMSS